MIFADTSFLAALVLRRDARHADATELLRARANDSVVLTNHVLGETWTLLRRRSGHGTAVRALDAIKRSPRYSVRHVDPALETEATDWLRRHDEREYSFVDAVSFAFMREELIDEALAFDEDFAAAGFTLLRA